MLDPRETMRLFSGAWSRGDVGALVSLMAADAIYRTSAGGEHVGRAAIRTAFEAVCRPAPEIMTQDAPSARMIFFDMHCLSFWSLQLDDSSNGEVQGIDFISFDASGLITCKDAYRKAFPTI